MLHSRLNDILKTFTVYELNRFGRFIQSPYFNEDKKVVQCFNTLAPGYKRQLEPPRQKAIWKAVYGIRPFSNIKFSRLCSDLAKKLDEFLVYDQLRNDEPQKLLNLAAIYNDRKLTFFFEPILKNARAKHQKELYREADFFLREFKLEEAQNAYLELQNQRSTEKNINQTLQALDRFYFIQKLNYLAALLHYKKFLSTEGEVALAGEILDYLKKKPAIDVPAIDIGYRIVLSLLEPEHDEHFVELKKLLALHAAHFHKNTARGFYVFAINFCIRRINAGKLNYVNESLLLYKEMLQNDLMTDETGALSQFDYKNIVTVALRTNDLAWAEKFIREYKNKLPLPYRQNAYTFNLAKLYFAKRKFDKVLPLLQDVVYTDIFYQLDSKTTLMKTYYELGEYLPMMALKESFRVLLRRKKLISAQNRINYTNFMRFTMQLYRLDVKDTPKLNQLSKNIHTSTNVADKGWLVEKLNELS